MSNNILKNVSDTEVSKQLYNVNAATYISVLAQKSCAYMDKNHKSIVKMENNKEKFSKYEKKVHDCEEKVSKYCILSSEYQDVMNYYDDLITEFFSDKTYPWLTNDNLSDEEKDIIVSIAHDRGMCPYCHDDEFDAEKLAA